MKALLCVLLISLGGLGCARIYRPVEMTPARMGAPVYGLAGSIEPQPWGDNSGYEGKAVGAGLRVMVLNLQNHTDAEVELLRLDLPAQVTNLTPAQALKRVKQQPLLFLLYPVLPGLMIPGSSNTGSFGPSPRALAIATTVVLGIGIGVPNAVVAAHSNSKIRAFFENHAWSPGRLKSGQVHRGLVFLACPDLSTPQTVGVVYRNANGEHRLELVCPGLSPLL